MPPKGAKAVKLAELNPTWVGAGGKGVSYADGSPVPERHGVGLLCDCPCGCGSRLYVPFANPLDGGPPLEPDRSRWLRDGDTFEAVTLSPSIRRIPHDGSCGWHGYIRSGGIETCGDSTPATAEYVAMMNEFNK
jgi:hypothetical protein